MKKTIKTLLVIGICLLLAGISKQTKAEQYPQEETVAGLTYELDEEETGYLVTKWDGVSEEVTIPDELHGIPVRAVGSLVFQGRKLLRKITFGKNISRLPGQADGSESASTTMNSSPGWIFSFRFRYFSISKVFLGS